MSVKDIKEDNSTKPLSDDLFVMLERAILSGELKPDQKLTEQSICKKYKVSRTPVREALRQLEFDGLIENIPNRGAYVIGLTQRDISDLFDMRSIFEVQAVMWAIERMTNEEIEALRETIEFMEFYTLKDDAEKVMYFNTVFHNIIYIGTKNKMLRKTLSSYQKHLKYSAPPKTYTNDYLQMILKEHQQIFKALERRNVAAGKRAMEYHMRHSKLRRMAKVLTE